MVSINLEDTSIMVTGGAGFIGSHLVDSLISEHPYEIVVVDNMFLGKRSNLREAERRAKNLKIFEQDASDIEKMGIILKDHDIDIVFNLAVLPLPHSLEYPKACNDKNVEIVSTICELQRQDYFKKLVHFSSSEAYGSARYRPMDEKHPLGPSTPYAASKAAGDILVLSYYRTFGTDSAIVRPFNNYGPRQNDGSYAGIIPLTIKRLTAGNPPVIYGDGKQTRDYIYVTETARMAIEMAKRNVSGKTINAGSGQETDMLTVVNEILKNWDTKHEIVFEAERPGDVRRHIANVYLAEDLLSFKTEISFEDGMRQTVDWYKNRGIEK